MAIEITLEEWLKEIDSPEGLEEDGFTKNELASKLCRSASWVERKIREANSAGFIEISRRRKKKIDGTVAWIPIYKLRKGDRKKC